MEAAQNATHTSLESALQEVLKTSQTQNGLIMGIHQCSKALDKREALLCILAKNCDEPDYVKLVEGLCSEHKIDLVKVDDSKQLGEWSGLCKVDREGNARKVVGTSCVVVKDWVMDTPGLHYLQQNLKFKV